MVDPTLVTGDSGTEAGQPSAPTGTIEAESTLHLDSPFSGESKGTEPGTIKARHTFWCLLGTYRIIFPTHGPCSCKAKFTQS